MMRITTVEQKDLQEESGAWTRSTSETMQCASQSSAIIDTKDDRAQAGPPTLRECLIKTTMSNALKPLILTCCAAGLVFHVDFGRNGMRKYVTFSHCYSLVVMLFLAFSVLYYLMIFHSDAKLDASFLMEIAMSVYNIESFAHFVCFYVASWKQLPEFFIQREKVQSVYSSPLTSIKRQVYIATAVLWIVMIIFTAASAYFLFGTPLQDLMLIPSKTDDLRADIIKLVKVVSGCFQAFAWLAPSAFIFVVADALSHEFNGLTRHIRITGDRDVTKIKEILEPVRRHHQRLCNLVGLADGIFSLQIAVTLCGSFLTACLIVYVVIHDQYPDAYDTLLLITQIVWLVTSLAKMSTDCISGAMLNEAVSIC